jgi:acyl-ACP thioesterase
VSAQGKLRQVDQAPIEEADSELSSPGDGRLFSGAASVHLSDVLPSGRARLDTVARWLQDVAADDMRDAGVQRRASWVVRRCALRVHRLPRFGDDIELQTWCSGSGHAWAERRTTVASDGHLLVDATALWVSLDPRTGRPQQITEPFFTIWGTQSRRRVGSRLLHRRQPEGDDRRPFPLRASDFDVLGHVNNAVAWVAVEEALAGRPVDHTEIEYRAPIDPGMDVRLQTVRENASLWCWLVDATGTTFVSARARLAAQPSEPFGRQVSVGTGSGGGGPT